MIYNSSLFLLYFLPVFLVLYYLADRRYRNGILLIAGIFFYAWGAPKFVFWVMGSVVLDFFLLKGIAAYSGGKRKLLFWLSILLNLGLLVWFKYMNFFVGQADTLLSWLGHKPAAWTAIALPVGISFITFQKLACTLDVYKKRFTPFGNFLDYSLYIFMFPQLLSGPIVRPGQIAAQITDRSMQDGVNDRLAGFIRFAIGLAKKVLIADVLAAQVNTIFALSSLQLSTGLAWTGAIAYTFQIYFDFSGYTDMAIGLARMAGFRLPENFNFPYVSASITEFWRRWHMTLSFWFRDFVFLPLAYAISRRMPKERYLGLRADKIIYLMATSVTFLLCGFWHGAAWTFILWGAYQGLFLILDRFFLLKIFKKTGRIPAMAVTFLITVFGWVLFRSESLGYFHFYVRRMVTFTAAQNDLWINAKFWTMMVVAALFAFAGISKRIEQRVEKLYDNPRNSILVVFTIVALLLFILSEATITSTGFSPFIYFRF
jgi:alginate O-acetyltransferase complex protein AlgI